MSDDTTVGEVVDVRDLGAFIPSVLDDYPLDPYEFRVYARVVRRASGKRNERGHDEGAAAMGRALGCSERQVRYALRVLERAGLVARTSRPGSTDRFDLTPTSAWVAPERVAKIRAEVRSRKAAPTPAPGAGPAHGAAPETETPARGAALHEVQPGTPCSPPLHQVPGTPAPGADEGSPGRASPEGESSASPRSAATGRGRRVDPVAMVVDGETLEVDPNDARGSFERWWAAYPRHPSAGTRGGGGRRKVAWDRWRNQLSVRQRAAALAAIGHYPAHLAATGYPPMHAEKWLSTHAWDDYADPPQTGGDGLDELAVAVAAGCGLDVDALTGQARGDVVTAASALSRAGAEPGHIPEAVKRWRADLDSTPTPLGLAKRWPRYAAQITGTRASVACCGRCNQPRDGHDDELCHILTGAA